MLFLLPLWEKVAEGRMRGTRSRGNPPPHPNPSFLPALLARAFGGPPHAAAIPASPTRGEGLFSAILLESYRRAQPLPSCPISSHYRSNPPFPAPSAPNRSPSIIKHTIR